MGYEIFEMLCNRNGVKPAQVSKATGVATSTLTNWKKGAYKPKLDKLQKIADYFNVSLDYLMFGHELEIRMESKVTEHPCLYDLGFMNYVFKLWNLPTERKDPILRQIRLEYEDYIKETTSSDSESLKKGTA